MLFRDKFSNDLIEILATFRLFEYLCTHPSGIKRATTIARGYDSKWRTARNRFLKVNPLCIRCKDEDRLVKATVVDHIKPHRGDKNLFWDKSNWQALCKRCHDKKTMTEDRYKKYKY